MSVSRMKDREHLGVLLTPRSRTSVDSVLATGLPWACDNGAYSGFAPQSFWRLCERAAGQPRLLWFACPDVVADAQQTLRWFGDWSPAMHKIGLPVAFVGQDGLNMNDVPWGEFRCLFLGGSTEWKLSHAAWDLAREAKRRGKLVHMGRVNSLRRMRIAQLFGCDSVDGSSASMFGDKYIHKYCRWLGGRLKDQPLLPAVAAH